MKTLFWVLGGLFILSRLNHSGLSVAGTVTAAASPFGTTPAGGGAGFIIPQNMDPYQNLYGQSGGGGAAPILPVEISGASTTHNIPPGIRPFRFNVSGGSGGTGSLQGGTHTIFGRPA